MPLCDGWTKRRAEEEKRFGVFVCLATYALGGPYRWSVMSRFYFYLLS